MKVNFHICFILDPILPNIVTNGDNNFSIGPLSADDLAREPNVILWAMCTTVKTTSTWSAY